MPKTNIFRKSISIVPTDELNSSLASGTAMPGGGVGNYVVEYSREAPDEKMYWETKKVEGPGDDPKDELFKGSQWAAATPVSLNLSEKLLKKEDHKPESEVKLSEPEANLSKGRMSAYDMEGSGLGPDKELLEKMKSPVATKISVIKALKTAASDMKGHGAEDGQDDRQDREEETVSVPGILAVAASETCTSPDYTNDLPPAPSTSKASDEAPKPPATGPSAHASSASASPAPASLAPASSASASSTAQDSGAAGTVVGASPANEDEGNKRKATGGSAKLEKKRAKFWVID